jgi:hypothetical protein
VAMDHRLRSQPFWTLWVGLTLVSCVLASNPASAADCLDALFTCETNRAGKYAQICATEVKVGEVWKDIYYRFGAEGVQPELVYPANPVPAKRVFFFSHTVVGSDYRVSVRLVSGDYTYRIYSNSGQGTAGVLVSDSRGNVVSNAKCIERPYMFPSYLQRALACDEETQYGAAACADKPLHVPK